MCTELTLLNFDESQQAVLSPASEGDFQLPAKGLLWLTDDHHFQQFVAVHHGQAVAHFDSITKVAQIYQLTIEDQTMVVAQAPLGSAAAVMILESLIAFGVRQVLAVGSCGALVSEQENRLLLPQAALRDEGCSFHYLPASNWVTLEPSAIKAIQTELERREYSVKLVKTWTTDAIFRETKAKISAVKAVGCQVVEMECAALAACAQFRQIEFAQLLYTADSLANLNRHDPRHWGEDAVMPTIDLAAQVLASWSY